jgi:hypothetical protein
MESERYLGDRLQASRMFEVDPPHGRHKEDHEYLLLHINLCFSKWTTIRPTIAPPELMGISTGAN